MKKILFLALTACMTLGSCTSKNESNAAATAATDSAAVATEAVETPATEAADAVIALKPSDTPEPTAEKPAVIDFWATWCGPCMQFKPVFHKVAEELSDKATFYSADCDECEDLSNKYKISSIPCIIILKKDAEPVSKVGYMSEEEFKAFLDKNL